MDLRAHKNKIIAAFLSCALIAIFISLPFAVRPGIEVALQSSGFPDARVGKMRFLPGGIFIEEISLDANRFSTIEDIQVLGRWPDLILKRRAEKVSVKSVTVSGEIDRNNRLVIAGWNGKLNSNDNAQGQILLPFKSFYLDGLTLDLDTPAGAIRTQAKANIEVNSQGEQILNASVWAGQKQFTTSVELHGTLDAENVFAGKAEISDTSIDVSPLLISRLSGWVEFRSGKPFTLLGQAMAGGMKYNEIPFEDVNLTFDNSQDSIAVFKTKITGQPVTIEGEWISKPESKLKAGISAPSLASLINLAQGADSKPNELLSGTGPTNIAVSLNPETLTKNPLPLSAILSFPERKLAVTSDLVYDRALKKLSGKISPVVMDAADFGETISLEDLTRLKIGSGRIQIGGDFTADFSSSPVKVSGPLDVLIGDLSGEIFDYKFEKFSGNLKMASLYPWQTAPDQEFRLGSLQAGKQLTDGILKFDGGADGFSVHETRAKLAGGIFRIRPFNWYTGGKENSFVIQLDNIQLTDLIGKESSSLKATGSVSGTIPMILTGKDVMISNGILKSDQPGSFKYAPEKLPASLQGDDSRMETVRLALSDYHYETLEMTVNGPLNGNLKTSLKAKGSSPVFDGRAVNLNLNLEGALTSALRQALQPGQLAGKLQKKFAEDAK